MSDASRLVEAMRKAAKPKENEIVDIVTGTVTSINPLKIKTDKIELTESFLILGALCKRTTIKIPNDTLAHTHDIPSVTTESTNLSSHGSHTHSTSDGASGSATVTDHEPHAHMVPAGKTGLSRGYFPEIVLWRDLQVGDDVYMLRCSAGQKYYVLQRKEGIV